MAGQPWRGAVAVSERLKQIHQTTDSVSICKPVTKFSAEVDSPESVAEVLTNAFRSAESGRPGAALVSLPKDIMANPAQCEVLSPSKYSAAGPADQAAIQEAARVLNQSTKPVVLLGLLASKPENATAVQQVDRRRKAPSRRNISGSRRNSLTPLSQLWWPCRIAGQSTRRQDPRSCRSGNYNWLRSRWVQDCDFDHAAASRASATSSE